MLEDFFDGFFSLRYFSFGSGDTATVEEETSTILKKLVTSAYGRPFSKLLISFSILELLREVKAVFFLEFLSDPPKKSSGNFLQFNLSFFEPDSKVLWTLNEGELALKRSGSLLTGDVIYLVGSGSSIELFLFDISLKNNYIFWKKNYVVFWSDLIRILLFFEL